MEPHIVDELSAFKLAFRRHAAGVAVVTGRTPDGTPVGFTATSLASLAAVPPLATFNMARISTAWPAIEGPDPSGSTHVLIHLLGARNRALADRLAGPHEDRFVGSHWAPGPLGLPLLNDVPAWMLGRIVKRVLGAEDDALLYHERAYMSPGDVVPG